MTSENKGNIDSKRITTIKISTHTKSRLDHLKSNDRESYEDVLKRVLSILNVCRVNPDLARNKLRALDNFRDSNKSS